MITISLCMIVKDEEKTLSRCLNSIKDIVDEIIIVDTGSTDNTINIAKQFTNNIYNFKWNDNFADARNFSFSKATKEYIMWLDADDIIYEKDKFELLKLKENLSFDIDTIIMRYDLTNKSENKIISSFYRERIVKANNNFKWYDPVHEYILFSGKYIKVDIAVTHNKLKNPTRRNLNILEKFIENGNILSERNWFYYARELFNFKEYKKASIYYEKFLNTENGLNSNYLDACMELSDCYIFLNDKNKSLQSLIRYFEKFPPRAEICCKLGYYFKNLKKYEQAIQWFELAPNTKKPTDMGSYSPDNWGYIPYMELTSCYYRLGNIDKAIYYNEKASSVYPNDDKICYNREFLSKIKNNILKNKK